MMTGAVWTLGLSAALLQFGWLGQSNYFTPANRLAGIGVDRERMSEAVLTRRTELMIDTQTFSILRDPQALAGAQRITSPKLQRVFNDASAKSGLPASFIASVAYLESWGNAAAESPAGPKGIMQIAAGTARLMGLRMIYATRYRVVVERKQVKGKGRKLVTKTVRRRVPYQVLVRDERLFPERAVPAAAQYLARMESRYGARDWAVFAYHCGEGCVSEILNIVRSSKGFGPGRVSVAQAFFGFHPAYNHELYEAIQHHMERDFSPTYWFRITRAEQLLKLYQENPDEFKSLFYEYRNHVNPEQRAPHRLYLWLKPEDLSFRSCEDLKRESGKKLVKAFDNAKHFGFSLRTSGTDAIGGADPVNREYYEQASPSVMGTLAYVAYETRRLHEAMKPKNERFVPLEVTALVQPLDYEERLTRRGPGGKLEPPSHCSGQVFDVNYGNLPSGEREALDFVLSDLGFNGYIGFIRDGGNDTMYHIGPAPTARDFFTRVYSEASENRTSD